MKHAEIIELRKDYDDSIKAICGNEGGARDRINQRYPESQSYTTCGDYYRLSNKIRDKVEATDPRYIETSALKAEQELNGMRNKV